MSDRQEARGGPTGRRNPYQAALDRARHDLSDLDPYKAALRSGGRVQEGPEGLAVELAYWGHQVQVAWTVGQVRMVSGDAVSTTVQLLIMHYLVRADGTPLADRWVSFRDLPDGRVYHAAFRKRACVPLAQAFGEHLQSLLQAGQRLGAEKLAYGDAALMFRVLPRVRVATILYAPDEEFPADANVLFDATVHHYLPIEDIAVLGGLVARELVRAKSGAP